ncbi:DNA/RNA polymerases superfamily protein [Gossypium australe]|uniref:DNA/RNA polymerases superfamily protein n=1 Tax=Gossypium australe TaxID=47621 RepID=A0A5B6UXB4_9ROSI|nr:DNA/RNA polymerases superfamily protein [Gossypium australe]
MYVPLVEFAYKNNFYVSLKMSPFEALYGRNCKTPICWIELSERKLVGLALVRETEEKVAIIRNHLKASQDHQKTYEDLKRKEISFEVFLKVSYWKKIIKFDQKGKLSPRFVGPYEVLERFGPVAYKLALPPEPSKIHNVFHVSMLRRYKSNPDHVVQIEELEVELNLSSLYTLLLYLVV